MIYSIGLDETSSTQIDDYIEEKVIEVLSQAINNEEWCEDNSIRQDIKDIKEHLDRHNDSLHTMYEAINAVSQMTGKQKMLLDTHKELIEDLKEKVEDND